MRLDGHGTTEILEAVLKLFPLDKTPNNSISVMATEDGQSLDIRSAYSAHCDDLNQIERFKFHEITKTVYFVIATFERALYANAILTKGGQRFQIVISENVKSLIFDCGGLSVKKP